MQLPFGFKELRRVHTIHARARAAKPWGGGGGDCFPVCTVQLLALPAL
jgi:hypothetical protein